MYVHLCTAFYFVIVLALESSWSLPYHELIGLWTLGSLMVGVAALPAGMLSDKIGASNMMVLFFVGMGISAIGAGFSDTPLALAFCLTGLGVFAAIYHPVGIPWLVRRSVKAPGKALGLNGVFGSFGTAGAGLTAGLLIDTFNWRWAFIVPGTVSLLTGIVLLGLLGSDRLKDAWVEQKREETESKRDMVRAFGILLVTMFLAGLVYHVVQTSLPKVFAERHNGLLGEGAAGVGVLVAIVYATAGVMQYVGGYLADRFPIKVVYLATILIQVPALWLAASFAGLPLVFVAMFIVMSGATQLPAENMLLARFTPKNRHGTAFGLKFVLSFGAAPLAVQFVAAVNARTQGFFLVFAIAAGLGAISFAAATFLPNSKAVQAR